MNNCAAPQAIDSSGASLPPTFDTFAALPIRLEADR
jgi:hypothetical protein